MISTGGNGSNDDRFEAAYRKYYSRVWRYYRSCRVSDDESHDLTQDAFKRLWDHWDSIRNEEVWPFLEKIAQSILYNYVRKWKTAKRNAKVVEIDDPEVAIDLPALSGPGYEEREETARRQELLERAVRELPKGQRDCLVLWLQGLSYEQIQKILGITGDAVKSRIRDAKRSLRERLGEKP